MIDIEAELFSAVVAEVKENDWAANVLFYNDTPISVQHFPCVTIVERDNRTVEQNQSSSRVENYATLDYEVNVYTNSKSQRKAEAKKIMAAVDEAFLSRGFRRRILEQMPEPQDWSIFRMLARYTAIVDTDKVIYNRP